MTIFNDGTSWTQVYEDDTLDAEDEKKIADAIKKETDIAKLVDILKKDKEAKWFCFLGG